MSLEHELAELSTVYQSTVERNDILELQVNALHERIAELEQLVRDYHAFSLLTPQTRTWNIKAKQLQERKQDLLHE